MKHLRVIRMKPLATEPASPDDYWIDEEVGGEEKITGQFEKYTWPEGTKLAGETRVRFVDDDGALFWLAHGGDKVEMGKAVTLTAHRVEPSRHIARVGGPYLWIVDIEAR